MFEWIRWYSRTHPPGRDESTLLALLAAPGALLLMVVLAFLNTAEALAGAGQVYVRLPADMAAPSARRLVSALQAQLADLAPIDLSEPSAERALCVVLITEVDAGLSIQLANARAEPLSAPRLVPGDADELSASQVASIVRAFVVARLDRDQVSVPAVARTERAKTGHTAEQSDAQERAPQADDAQGAPREAQREPKPSQAATALLASPPAPDAAADAHSQLASESAGARRPVAIDRLRTDHADVWRLRLAALYSGVGYAPELPWQNGLRLETSARLQRWLYLGTGYGYQLPGDINGEGVQVRIQAHSVNAFLGLERHWRNFGAGLDAGLGALKTWRATTQVVEGLEDTDDFAYWSALGTLRLHGRLRFPALPRFALDLAPALELVGGTRRALVDTGTSEETFVLSPRSVRARVDVGAAFDVF
jgi:hypothetical protein